MHPTNSRSSCCPSPQKPHRTAPNHSHRSLQQNPQQQQQQQQVSLVHQVQQQRQQQQQQQVGLVRQVQQQQQAVSCLWRRRRAQAANTLAGQAQQQQLLLLLQQQELTLAWAPGSRLHRHIGCCRSSVPRRHQLRFAATSPPVP
ncbi:hypothetical protein, conserved [Eimeria tenella]|uniref:Uncharacterized protein n=1 Tax=Eimeria tenella TaxID=5802 RepID=U6L159_EIMTE|nr:hypothetical protein, conserved [Eimeria tenella]CDJ42918.1 hypothetical protein, conserved [Eimeria tenella]|eukprot:XP_013233668.1 hypothetical protein, conserved [Eimeria tenella]